jgi:hypothetical protein
MKLWIVSLITIVAVAAGWLLRSIPFKNASATTEAAHREFDQHARKIISLAESMPTNKYGYAPAYSDNYFMEIVTQVTSETMERCGQLMNRRLPSFKLPPPEGRPSPDAFPQEMKNDAVRNLKSSMDLCGREFLFLNDSQLNEVVTAQGAQRVTKADVMMDLVGYIAQAESETDTYLKLSGIAPGTKIAVARKSLETKPGRDLF